MTLTPPLNLVITELWWVTYNLKIDSDKTDAVGKVTFKPGASSYPIVLQVRIPENQNINGVIYEGAGSPVFNCYDGTVKNTTIVMTPKYPTSYQPKAEIVELVLPDELNERDSILGSIKIKNVGLAKGSLRILLTTEWDNNWYESIEVVPVGDTLTVNLLEGRIVMPSQDAVMTIEAQHLEDGVWVTDDTKTH